MYKRADTTDTAIKTGEAVWARRLAKALSERDNFKKQRNELLAVCKLALEHLEYCNYGDRWEKECAVASGLPGKLYNAIEHTENGASNLNKVNTDTATN